MTVIGAFAFGRSSTTQNALDRAPVFVHLDLDVIDPEFVPRDSSSAGGLAPDKLYDLLEAVSDECEVIGFEVTAFEAPEDELERQDAAGERCTCSSRCSMPCQRGPVSQAEDQAARARRGRQLVARPPLRSLVEDLHERREQAALGGGEEKIERQHAEDKLTARERLALLIDEGTFTELGIHGRPHFSQRAMEGKEAPADGVVTGYGKVDGRLVAVCAYDFTVMAGSMGMTGELKVAACASSRSRSASRSSGCSTPPARASRRRPARCSPARAPLPRGGGDERRGPADRGADGAVRGGHRLHPRPGRLRADGEGPRLDGARRSAT